MKFLIGNVFRDRGGSTYHATVATNTCGRHRSLEIPLVRASTYDHTRLSHVGAEKIRGPDEHLWASLSTIPTHEIRPEACTAIVARAPCVAIRAPTPHMCS